MGGDWGGGVGWGLPPPKRNLGGRGVRAAPVWRGLARRSETLGPRGVESGIPPPPTPLFSVRGALGAGDDAGDAGQQRSHQPGPGSVFEEAGGVPQCHLLGLGDELQPPNGRQSQHSAGCSLPGGQRFIPALGVAGCEAQPQRAAGHAADGGEGPRVEAQPGGVLAPSGGQTDGPERGERWGEAESPPR